MRSEEPTTEPGVETNTDISSTEAQQPDTQRGQGPSTGTYHSYRVYGIGITIFGLACWGLIYVFYPLSIHQVAFLFALPWLLLVLFALVICCYPMIASLIFAIDRVIYRARYKMWEDPTDEPTPQEGDRDETRHTQDTTGSSGCAEASTPSQARGRTPPRLPIDPAVAHGYPRGDPGTLETQPGEESSNGDNNGHS